LVIEHTASWRRDGAPLVRIFCWGDAKGSCLLGHASINALAAGEQYMLDQLTVSAQPSCWFSPRPRRIGAGALAGGLATASRLSVLEGLSL